MRSLTFFALLAPICLGYGCSNGSDALQSIQLRASGIEPLAAGYHYEAWAVIDGSPVTLAKFNVDLSQAITDLEGFAIRDGIVDTQRDLEVSSGFLITIEQPGDMDITPSDSTYLSGLLVDGGAELTTAGELAFDDSFADATGRYFLATPTDGNMDRDETSGVWFFDISTDPVSSGLTLPELPIGFVYEGWAVIDGMPITTGRFTSSVVADQSAPFSATVAPGPNFPGEDFLINAPSGLAFPTDLSTMRVVVSIEPEPDDSPSPFTLKLLVADVQANAADRQTFAMDNNHEAFPSISVDLLP